MRGSGIMEASPEPPVYSLYRNEYVLEAAYVLQITPFAKLQPDLQFVWNPANNPNADHALVFQLQLNVAW
jgi:carbohydrate-selective porin OprB